VKLTDPLSFRELSALLGDPVFRGRGVPRGDGRPVLLIPGILSGDWALRVMNNWLGRMGYKPYLSGIFLNVLHPERMLVGLRQRLAEVNAEAGSRVSLVGHSHGGLLAKVLSQRRPRLVEQVIALGSPLANWTDIAPITMQAVGVVRVANEIAYGRRLSAAGRFSHDLEAAPNVPITSIYTKEDEVVNYRSCLRPDIPAMPVWGSHNGLLVNPEVYRLLGRLLARPRRKD
jgi:pimeloyl-ACP methyl ester carboxylesterase